MSRTLLSVPCVYLKIVIYITLTSELNDSFYHSAQHTSIDYYRNLCIYIQKVHYIAPKTTHFYVFAWSSCNGTSFLLFTLFYYLLSLKNKYCPSSPYTMYVYFNKTNDWPIQHTVELKKKIAAQLYWLTAVETMDMKWNFFRCSLVKLE